MNVYSGSLLLYGINACALSVLANALKTKNAVDFSKQSVIGTSAYILTGMNVSSSLLYKDVARENLLTVRALYAKTLGLAVTAVLGGTHTFFMSE